MKKELSQQDKALEVNLFLKMALDSLGGRLFFDDLLNRCNVFTHGYQDNHADMAFLAGQRDIGLSVWWQLKDYDSRRAFHLFVGKEGDSV